MASTRASELSFCFQVVERSLGFRGEDDAFFSASSLSLCLSLTRGGYFIQHDSVLITGGTFVSDLFIRKFLTVGNFCMRRIFLLTCFKRSELIHIYIAAHAYTLYRLSIIRTQHHIFLLKDIHGINHPVVV